jgi:hypothetical protein
MQFEHAKFLLNSSLASLSSLCLAALLESERYAIAPHFFHPERVFLHAPPIEPIVHSRATDLGPDLLPH